MSVPTASPVGSAGVSSSAGASVSSAAGSVVSVVSAGVVSAAVSSVLAVEAQATSAKTMTTARSRAMIFFMCSFLLKNFVTEVTVLLCGAPRSKIGYLYFN